MGRGVVAVDPAAENGDGDSSGVERAAMRLTVDAASHPADDDQAGRRELPPERARHRAAVGRARTRPDDGDRRTGQELVRTGPAKEERRWRIVDRGEKRWEGWIAAAYP